MHPPIIGHRLEANLDSIGLRYIMVIPPYNQYPKIILDEVLDDFWEHGGYIQVTGWLDNKLVDLTVTNQNGKTIIEIIEK